MTYVVLICVALSAIATLWSLRRHRQLAAWDLELESAFVSGERPELTLGRVL